MAQPNNEIEFSEISKKYSDNKSAFNQIQKNIADVMELRKQVASLAASLQSLEAQEKDLSIYSRYLTDEERKNLEAEIQKQIQETKSQIENVKKDKLYKTKEQIEEASKDLDEYIQLASTNPDFQIALRDAVINEYGKKISEENDKKDKQNSYISFAEKLEKRAKSDAGLKDIFSSIEKIRTDAHDAESFKSLINDYATKHPDSKNQADALITAVENENNNNLSNLAAKADELKKYISDHREDFGLPAGTDDLNFDDENSPIYVVTQYTDVKNSKSLSEIKSEHFKEIKNIDKRIGEYNKYREYAREDITHLTVKREQEYQALYVSPWTRIKNFFKKVGHGIKNWFQDKPFKDPDEKQSIPAPETPKVVDNKDFIDAYKTEIGKDAYDQVINNYKEKVKQGKSQQSTRDQDGQSR